MKPSRAADGRQRVVLFTNSVVVGGMEQHVLLLARYLDRSRFEVIGVVPDWEPTRPFTESLGKEADRVEVITPDRRHGLRRQLAESVRLMRFVRHERVDTVHLHSTTFRGQSLAALCCRLGGARRVYVTEHLAPDASVSWPARLWRNLFTRGLTGLVCVSQKNYSARSTYLHTPAARTTIVPNGIDVHDFDAADPGEVARVRRQHDIPDGACVVGTVVRFEPEKGLTDLIDAFAIVREKWPTAILLLVGDGSLRAELAARVDGLGLAESVRFTGFQPDPRPYLAVIDVFVLPVPVGSMSIGLLEAMAMGCAPVMTFGGDGEAVVHGESGFHAEPHDPSSIARYVVQLLDDPALRHRIGAAARHRVESEFSAERVAESLSTVYAGETHVLAAAR
jgi:glycosyltransferase involved in cell wall biosynthesis